MQIKNIINTLILFIFASICIAQESIISAHNKRIKLFANKYDFLYKGFDNIIKLDTTDISLIIKSEFGQVISRNGMFFLNLTSEINSDFIDICIMNSDSAILSKRTFIVKSNKEFLPILSNVTSYYISKKDIISDPFLRIIRCDSIIENIKISYSFAMTEIYDDEQSTFIRFENNTSDLSEESLFAVGYSSPGQTLYIENIKCNFQNKIYNIPPLMYVTNGYELFDKKINYYPSEKFIDCEIIKYLPRY